MKLSKNENARPRPGGEIPATYNYKRGVKHFGNGNLWKRAGEAVAAGVKDLSGSWSLASLGMTGFVVGGKRSELRSDRGKVKTRVLRLKPEYDFFAGAKKIVGLIAQHDRFGVGRNFKSRSKSKTKSNTKSNT